MHSDIFVVGRQNKRDPPRKHFQKSNHDFFIHSNCSIVIVILLASLGLISKSSFHFSVLTNDPLFSMVNFVAASNSLFWFVRWEDIKTSRAFSSDKCFSKYLTQWFIRPRILYFSARINKSESKFSSLITQSWYIKYTILATVLALKSTISTFPDSD